jgi:hypothetical protein
MLQVGATGVEEKEEKYRIRTEINKKQEIRTEQ